jgi:4-amino-4-deoxy-L-arabinose transferase-like glycosyltransferase
LKQANQTTSANALLTDRRLTWLLVVGCGLLFFVSLGAVALFEPDEGRNAERAREILLLGNWAIPHENFLPALDKPIFFYWFIAISYKLFGISEWSARLPSALAAIGCLFILFRFVRAHSGPWESFASVLILATSLQFFIYARIVIFDMTLTLFTTIALFEFYRVATDENSGARLWHCLIMYAAMALATLVKGPIGIAIPGMAIFCYLLIARKWRLLGEIHVVPGIFVFCAIVMPIYIWAEFKNPGYLRYFLWEENFLRFFTPHFQRHQPWYYFFLVITVGFLPWSVFLPSVIAARWKKKIADDDLFLLLWIVLPVLFFSLSSSKLPHYVLPIFPPLAILTARQLREIMQDSDGATRWQLSLPLLVNFGAIAYLMVGILWPGALPRSMRDEMDVVGKLVWLAGILSAIIIAIFFFGRARGRWRQASFVFGCHGAALFVYLFLMVQMMTQFSYLRSAKPMAAHFKQFLSPGDRLIGYNDYLTGMPFYLRLEQPIWIVWSGTKTIIMDNIYVAQKQPPPAAGYGQVLFTFAEFAQATRQAGQPLKIIIKTRNLNQLSNQDNVATRTLAEFAGYSLVTPR